MPPIVDGAQIISTQPTARFPTSYAYLVVADFVHPLHARYGARSLDAKEVLSERDGPEGAVKVEQADIGVDVEEACHILCVQGVCGGVGGCGCGCGCGCVRCVCV